MLKLAILVFAFAFANLGQAEQKFTSVEVDTSRLIYVRGDIGENSFSIANKIEQFSSSSTSPIHLLIASSGGSVTLGNQVLSAMNLAHSRGVKLVCYVPVLAASMAFQIFSQCDQRYALRNALLLWHPMKSQISKAMNKEDMLYESQRLRAWEIPFVKDLIAALKIKPSVFFYHRRKETLWMAFEFEKISPGFVTVVDDIKGVKDLFSIAEEAGLTHD